MVFALILCAVYIGFHNYITERDIILCLMSFLMVSNLVLQMTPCYTLEKYINFRIFFYFITLSSCLAIAFTARFYYATPEEIQNFFVDLIMSFVYLGVGFFFYQSKFPEKCLSRPNTQKVSSFVRSKECR